MISIFKNLCYKKSKIVSYSNEYSNFEQNSIGEITNDIQNHNDILKLYDENKFIRKKIDTLEKQMSMLLDEKEKVYHDREYLEILGYVIEVIYNKIWGLVSIINPNITLNTMSSFFQLVKDGYEEYQKLLYKVLHAIHMNRDDFLNLVDIKDTFNIHFHGNTDGYRISEMLIKFEKFNIPSNVNLLKSYATILKFLTSENDVYITSKRRNNISHAKGGFLIKRKSLLSL